MSWIDLEKENEITISDTELVAENRNYVTLYSSNSIDLQPQASAVKQAFAPCHFWTSPFQPVMMVEISKHTVRNFDGVCKFMTRAGKKCKIYLGSSGSCSSPPRNGSFVFLNVEKRYGAPLELSKIQEFPPATKTAIKNKLKIQNRSILIQKSEQRHKLEHIPTLLYKNCTICQPSPGSETFINFLQLHCCHVLWIRRIKICRFDPIMTL